jgi:SAM-dependent methyltransferase
MKYRHQQIDLAYRELQAMNRPINWAGRSFDDFALRDFLEQTLPTLIFSSIQPRALEYGTGTGPGACFLAARGFRVHAIDVSPTAIELAKKFADERRQKVRFEVGDICGFSSPRGAFDLVIDNFCMQSLVTNIERETALGNVRSILKRDGRFLIGAAIYRDGRDFGDGIFDERTGILYERVEGDAGKYEDAVRLNSHWYFARRRYVRPEVLRMEVERAGFAVLWQEGGRVICAPAG